MIRQITEEEWEATYEWLPTDEGENCSLLQIEGISDEVDDRYVWSEIDALDHNGYGIVPGRCAGAIGYYITRNPHNYDVEVDRPPPDDYEDDEDQDGEEDQRP